MSKVWSPISYIRSSPGAYERLGHYGLRGLLILLLCQPAMAYQACGLASHYGHNDGFDGRITASGAYFNKNVPTTAHRWLPFGTLLLVRNTQNNKEIIVKVTDRGPFYPLRIIDLSYAAFGLLENPRNGVMPVCIKTID